MKVYALHSFEFSILITFHMLCVHLCSWIDEMEGVVDSLVGPYIRQVLDLPVGRPFIK